MLKLKSASVSAASEALKRLHVDGRIICRRDANKKKTFFRWGSPTITEPRILIIESKMPPMSDATLSTLARAGFSRRPV